jgi:hypothetical protein
VGARGDEATDDSAPVEAALRVAGGRGRWGAAMTGGATTPLYASAWAVCWFKASIALGGDGFGFRLLMFMAASSRSVCVFDDDRSRDAVGGGGGGKTAGPAAGEMAGTCGDVVPRKGDMVVAALTGVLWWERSVMGDTRSDGEPTELTGRSGRSSAVRCGE